MANFESYSRRIDQINAVLKEYGFKDLDEAKEFALQKGVDAEAIVRESLRIASSICVYTNSNISVEKL